MVEEQVEDMEASVPDAPVKPRKPRKPRKPKAEKAEKQPKADEPANEPDKKGEQFVRQQGTTVTLSGKSVVLNGLSKDDIKKWGVEEVRGTIGKPCKTPMVLTFKSRKAALAFFDFCLEEDEDEDVLTTSEAVNWYSEELGF